MRNLIWMNRWSAGVFSDPQACLRQQEQENAACRCRLLKRDFLRWIHWVWSDAEPRSPTWYRQQGDLRTHMGCGGGQASLIPFVSCLSPSFYWISDRSSSGFSSTTAYSFFNASEAPHPARAKSHPAALAQSIS